MGQKPNPIPVAHINSKAFMFRVVKTPSFDGSHWDWQYDFEFKRPDETYWHTGESWFEENRHDIAKNIKDWMTGFGVTV